MMRKIVTPLMIAAVVLVVGYLGLIWHNNVAVQSPTQAEIAGTWEKSVAWLASNREMALADRNPILWWMIGESAKLTGDVRLQQLFADYRATTNAAEADSVWQTFFAPERYWGASFSQQSYAGYADYQQYFLFGLTCSKQLADEAIIVDQHDTDFCRRRHPLSPACVTHQMMGFRFAQRVGCDRLDNLPEKISRLQIGSAARAGPPFDFQQPSPADPLAEQSHCNC